MDRPATLLVGDETAAFLFRDAGHHVLSVADPHEILALVAEKNPDAVVLDAGAGPALVLEICQKIKKSPGFMPIMVLGTRWDVTARVEALEAGADDVLQRPYDSRELLARVDVLVRTRRRFEVRRRSPSGELAAAGIVDEGERDRLTGLGNQRFFTRQLDEHMREAARLSETLSVLAVDLDGLDEVNGRYGRGAGDRLLAACARAIERGCRLGDVLARAGGDEFVVILPRLHVTGAAQIAERVRGEIEAVAVLDAGARIGCQASVGVASYPSRDVDSAKDLLRFAHAALARAKEEGRGQVCLYQQHGYLMGPAPRVEGRTETK